MQKPNLVPTQQAFLHLFLRTVKEQNKLRFDARLQEFHIDIHFEDIFQGSREEVILAVLKKIFIVPIYIYMCKLKP